MSTYSFMNLSLLCSTAFFAAASLMLLLDKFKSKKLVLHSLEKQKKLYATLFVTRESNLREVLGEELSIKLNACIAEIISIEKKSYKNLSVQFTNHHPEALDAMPSTVTAIITAYLSCISQLINLNNEKINEKKQVDISEAHQFSALIEELSLEKQNYIKKYADALKLLNLVFIKYKDKIDVENINNVNNLSVEQIASVFKIENFAKSEL